MRKKPDGIIIHEDTNGLTNDINTMSKSIAKIIEEMNDGDDIQVGFSGISERRDHNPSEKIKGIKKRLKNYYHSNDFLFIDNSNAYENSLNKSLLYFSESAK